MTSTGAAGRIVHDEDVAQAKRHKRALRSFRRDEHMETLLELRKNEPKRFAELPDLERLAVDHYATARKAAHEAALAAEEGDEAA
jgi:hypothetical protein